MTRCSPARSVALVAALCGLAGCSALTTMYGRRDPDAQRPVPVPGTQLFDWKGVVHCHSRLSHDSKGKLAEIVAACREASVDFVVMTDHQSDASIFEGVGGRIGRTLFVVGAEIRTPQGTVIAFPLRTPLRRWQHAGVLAAEAAGQGAVVLHCHAEQTKAWDVRGFTGVEIVNLHAGALATNKAGLMLVAMLFPLRIAMKQICRRNADVFAHWDEQLRAHHPLTPVGGNDAHDNVRVFGAFGPTLGNYRELFLTLSTHVLAGRMDEEALVEAFRAGRSYVSFDIFGEGSGFDFRATDVEGIHLPGATVGASGELVLCITAPARSHIRLLRDGRSVREDDGVSLQLREPSPGVYRVEVETLGRSPWLFSSSIRVVQGQRPGADAVDRHGL